jgi:glycine cleavage system H lipoate-binding protein
LRETQVIPDPENLAWLKMEKSKMSGKAMKEPAARKEDRCIWMQAGVVRKKHCREKYQCSDCAFDRALQRAARESRGNIVSWEDRLRERPYWQRPCIHHMKGDIEYRSCTNDYHCGNCDFDQYFLDQYTVHAVVSPVESFEVRGFRIPQGYYFHQGHTWAKLEQGPSVRIGIDDFALRVLGPFDRIECPLMGKEVEQGKGAISVIREDKSARMLSPVTGVVTSINTGVRETGRLANEDPYAGGWIMTVHSPDLRKELKNLTINQESKGFIGAEVERLFKVIEEVEGPLSTDGGALGSNLLGTMPKLGWERLTRLFLRN